MNKILFLLLFTSQTMVAQRNNFFLSQKDSINKSRILYSNLAIGSGYAGSLIALQSIWYKSSFQKNFHFFNDGNNWLQMDKSGHFYTSYQLSKGFSDLYKWTGVPKKKASLIGSGISLSYLTCLELMDGFSKDWGFSVWDITANVGGTAFYIGQELLFSEQIFQPKFSFHPTKYADIRPEVLGANFTEQLLKDYNGQTYWVSFSPGKLGVNQFPHWLCMSLGYSADAKLVGNSDIYLSYKAKREFLISMDIDFTQIKVKRPFLRMVFKQLNVIKIPFPALYYSNNQFGFKPFYF